MLDHWGMQKRVREVPCCQSSGEEKYANTELLCGVFRVIKDTHKATDPTNATTRSTGEISGLRERC